MPVEDLRAGRPRRLTPAPTDASSIEADLPLIAFDAVESREGWEGRTSLFGEPER